MHTLWRWEWLQWVPGTLCTHWKTLVTVDDPVHDTFQLTQHEISNLPQTNHWHWSHNKQETRTQLVLRWLQCCTSGIFIVESEGTPVSESAQMRQCRKLHCGSKNCVLESMPRDQKKYTDVSGPKTNVLHVVFITNFILPICILNVNVNIKLFIGPTIILSAIWQMRVH